MILLHLLRPKIELIILFFLWKRHIVIELAPHHGSSPRTVVIINPFIFYGLCSTSVTARLAPHLFFFSLFFSFFSPLMFWKGMGPKIRIADKESRFVPCQLKISCRERMQRRMNRGLMEAEHSQVIRVWSESWLRDTHLSHADTHEHTSTNHQTHSSWTLIFIHIMCDYTHTQHTSRSLASRQLLVIVMLNSCDFWPTNLFFCHFFMRRAKNTNWAQVMIKVEHFICICCNSSHFKFIVLPKLNVVSSCGWLPDLLSHALTLCETWGKKNESMRSAWCF